MKILGIVNQKGGVGKTQLSNNLAHYLKRERKRTLLVDLDPQASLSKINRQLIDKKESGAYNLILKQDLEVIKIDEYLDFIDSNFNLDIAINVLENKMMRENYLKKSLDRFKNQYDYIIIDSPPSFNLIFINILYAVDEILIPIKPELDSMQGLDYLLDTINELKSFDVSIKINGIVPMMVDKRRKQTIEIMEELEKRAKDNNAVVYPGIRLAAAIAGYSKSSTNIFDYKTSNARKDIEFFCKAFCTAQ